MGSINFRSAVCVDVRSPSTTMADMPAPVAPVTEMATESALPGPATTVTGEVVEGRSEVVEGTGTTKVPLVGEKAERNKPRKGLDTGNA